MSTELAVHESQGGAIAEYSPETVIQRLSGIHELMRRAMQPDIDYGKIPGTGSKPTLLKPGAEKLCLMFRLAPKYATQKTFDGQHLTVESTCQIVALDGTFLGEASAMASTKESKWAYRKAERICPTCQKPAIIKGKAEYGGGWICWSKKGGCNAKFADGAAAIEGQQTGRVANEDMADSYNTVLRIAEKRAYLAAVRLVTGCSSIFDEEFGQAEHVDEPESHQEPAKAAPKQEAAEFPKHVQAARAAIVACKTPDEFNAALATMPKNATAAEKTMLKDFLTKAARSQGVVFDAKAKKFVSQHASAGDLFWQRVLTEDIVGAAEGLWPAGWLKEEILAACNHDNLSIDRSKWTETDIAAVRALVERHRDIKQAERKS